MFASTLVDILAVIVKKLVKNIELFGKVAEGQEGAEEDQDSDFVMCSATSWVQTLAESKVVFQEPKSYSTSVFVKVLNVDILWDEENVKIYLTETFLGIIKSQTIAVNSFENGIRLFQFRFPIHLFWGTGSKIF